MTIDPPDAGVSPRADPDPEREVTADALADDAAATYGAEDDAHATSDGLDGYEQVRFVDVVMALPSTNPTVLLEEVSPPCRVLRIPIGLQEGAAIAYASRGIPTAKPLTHELFVSVLESFGLTVDFVRITSVHKSSFSGELVLSGPRGSRTLACRPSDGIALALRQRLGAPIMVAPDVLDEVGVEPGTS